MWNPHELRNDILDMFETLSVPDLTDDGFLYSRTAQSTEAERERNRDRDAIRRRDPARKAAQARYMRDLRARRRAEREAREAA